MRIYLLLAILFFAVNDINGDVFTLGPLFGKGGASSVFTIPKGMELSKEPIIINGEKINLHIKLLRNGLQDNILLLQKQFPKASSRYSSGAWLMEFKLKNKLLERLYLVEVGGPYPVIQFSMKFKNGLPLNNGEWLQELPKIDDAKILTTMILPDRNIYYGTFTTDLSPQAATSDIKRYMSSKGWESLDNGTYIKNNPLSILMASFSIDDNNKTRGFILKRPLVK